MIRTYSDQTQSRMKGERGPGLGRRGQGGRQKPFKQIRKGAPNSYYTPGTVFFSHGPGQAPQNCKEIRR